MKKRSVKKMQKAKGSLEKMMEMLRPYLPQKQVVTPETTQKWKLPEDHYAPSGHKKKRNPAAL
jgi:hypothetical protein